MFPFLNRNIYIFFTNQKGLKLQKHDMFFAITNVCFFISLGRLINMDIAVNFCNNYNCSDYGISFNVYLRIVRP